MRVFFSHRAHRMAFKGCLPFKCAPDLPTRPLSPDFGLSARVEGVTSVSVALGLLENCQCFCGCWIFKQVLLGSRQSESQNIQEPDVSCYVANMNSSEDVHSWSPHSSQSHESTADMVAAGRMSTVPYNLSSTSGHLDWNITASAEKKLAMEVANAIEFYAIPIVCSLGIALNVINVLVLTEHYLKESPYVYLRALSVVDLSALFMSTIFFIFTKPRESRNFMVSDGSPGRDFGIVYGAYIFFPLSNLCISSSTWIVVTLTVERYLFIRYPLWARDRCTPNMAKLKILLLLVVLLFLNVPRFMMYHVVAEKDPSGTEVRLHLKPTHFRHSSLNTAFLWVYTIVFGVVPLLILCFSNSYLVYAVRRARRQRQRLDIRNNMEANWTREQTRLTLTLIAIVFLAVVCILPSAFGDVVLMSYLVSRSHALHSFQSSSFYLIFRAISNFLLICNMSLNFVLYSAFNDKFVRVMRRMVRRWIDSLNRRGARPRRPSFQKIYTAMSHRTAVRSKSSSDKEGSSSPKTSATENTPSPQ